MIPAYVSAAGTKLERLSRRGSFGPRLRLSHPSSYTLPVDAPAEDLGTV